MAISAPYVPFGTLTDDQLTAALTAIDTAIVSYAEGMGQRTVSIGSVSFSYGSLADLLRIKEQLVAAYNGRVPGAKPAPYRITHLMR